MNLIFVVFFQWMSVSHGYTPVCAEARISRSTERLRRSRSTAVNSDFHLIFTRDLSVMNYYNLSIVGCVLVLTPLYEKIFD